MQCTVLIHDLFAGGQPAQQHRAQRHFGACPKLLRCSRNFAPCRGHCHGWREPSTDCAAVRACAEKPCHPADIAWHGQAAGHAAAPHGHPGRGCTIQLCSRCFVRICPCSQDVMLMESSIVPSHALIQAWHWALRAAIITSHNSFTSCRGRCRGILPVSGAHPAADARTGGGQLRLRAAQADAWAAGPLRELHRQQEHQLPAQRTRHQSRRHCLCCPVLQVCWRPHICAGIQRLPWALQQARCNLFCPLSISGMAHGYRCA